MEKYDSSLKGYKEHYFLNLMYISSSSMNLFMETYNAYKYNIKNTDDSMDYYKIESRIFDFVYNVEELLILSNKIIEVGDVSE